MIRGIHLIGQWIRAIPLLALVGMRYALISLICRMNGTTIKEIRRRKRLRELMGR